MLEFARLLRYVIPGGVFELLLAVGLFLTHRDDTLQLKDIGQSGQVWVTLLVVAAFPLGFLVSVIANEIAWFWHGVRQREIWRRVCFWRDAKICQPRLWGRISTYRILSIVAAEYPHRVWLRQVHADMRGFHRKEIEQAFVEVVLRFSHGEESYRDASQRLRSMADLMNGMINSTVAVALAFLLCAALQLYGVAFVDEADVNVVHTLIFCGVTLTLLTCLLQAECRLARITEAFAIGMIRAQWR